MRSWKTFAAAAALAAGLGVAAAPAAADTFRIKIGSSHPIVSVWIVVMKDFMMPKVAERVKAETGHTIEWTEAWASSVCKPGECLEAVESGLLDMVDIQTPFEPSKLIAVNFTYYVAFGAPDTRVVAKAAQQVFDETPALKQHLEKAYNQVFVTFGLIPDYGLVTNFKWDKVADLKGRKIAAAGPNIPWLEGSGVVGVQSSLPEAYTSMQTGVYDGWVMFPDGIVSFKLHELSKQYVEVGFGGIVQTLWTMNKETWNGLPENVRKIFHEVGREYTQRLAEVGWQRHQAALQRMKEAGIEIKVLPFEERVAWAKGLPNLPKIRAAEIQKAGQPAEIVYKYVDALKAAGHKFPRDWSAEK